MATPKKIKINIPDELKTCTINFTVFSEQPCLLLNHKWDTPPIGNVVEIKKGYKGIMFKPRFNNLTDESRAVELLHKEGLIINAEPGGYIKYDENGNVKEFIIYEISICNP